MKIEKNPGYLFKVVLYSGDDEYVGCKLVIAFWKWLITINMPQIIRPDTLKVRGEYNYDELIERAYGFYLYGNHFNILYGRGDANFNRDIFGDEQRWSCFLPWNEWRHVRHSLYGLNGEHFYTESKVNKGIENLDSFKVLMDAEEKCPKAVFQFYDYDGERIDATTNIEEREWLRGEKWFKWLSFFFKFKIRRSLNISFNKEVGKEKGSWKGGTVGHGIEMEPGETHEMAFKRYCQKNNLLFIKRI